MRGHGEVPGIRSDDSGGRERFLGALQEGDNGPGEFGEDSRHQQEQDDEEETEAQHTQDSHRNSGDG